MKRERAGWSRKAQWMAVGWQVGLGTLHIPLGIGQDLAASLWEPAEVELVWEESWARVRATAN